MAFDMTSIIRVGDGRGFITAASFGDRYVITAAHCLPDLPPPHGEEERTFCGLLGPINGECTVAAECVFVDPIADLAVLLQPDDQVMEEEYAAYGKLTEAATPLSVAEAKQPTLAKKEQDWLDEHRGHYTPEGLSHVLGSLPGWGNAQVVSLDLALVQCRIEYSAVAQYLTIHGAKVDAGMSGSPILSEEGTAIGVVALNSGGPRLATCLPGWLLRKFELRA
jgi:hypothetical protein